MRSILKDNKGFTLSEVLIAVSIIAVACALCVPAFTNSVEWARKRSALAELLQLNDAADYYRLEWGNDALPKGSNDSAHHEAILRVLVLKNKKNINIRQLKSSGEGESFYFTEYKGHLFEINENVFEEPSRYTSYAGSGEGGSNWKGSGCTLGETFLSKEAWEKGDTDFKEERDKKIVEEVKDFLRRKKPQQPFVEKKEYFEAPGAYDWMVPQGVSEITVQLVGGGGSGAKAKRKVNGWANAQTVPFQGVRIGRYDCKNGNFVTVGSYTLMGPLKLYVYSSPTCFVESFNVVINGGDKRYLSLGQENIIECDKEEPMKIDFLIRTPQPKAGCWEKGKKNFKMRYHDNFDFSLNLKVQYQDVTFFMGHGAGAGGYSKKAFSQLHGGETVFIKVGKGGQKGPGEATTVKLNDIQCSASGGKVGTEENPGAGGVGMDGDVNESGAVGLTSEQGGKGGDGFAIGSNPHVRMGAGGSGVADKALQAGENGNGGMVIITYKG